MRCSLGILASFAAAGSGCTLFTDVDSLGSGPTTTTAATVGAGGQSDATTAPASSSVVAGGGGAGGADGLGGCAPSGTYDGLRLNELAPEGEPDWIEIKNCGTEAIALCGVMLVEEFTGAPPAETSSYTFDEEFLEPDAFLVLVRYRDFQFGLAKDNDQRFSLVSPTLLLIDEAAWPESVLPFSMAESWARVPDCGSLFSKTPPSPGAPN